ncbi:hypothetical protein [Streptomyces sp. NPDC020983]|uniref:hypothetical protein n=1 Tax=Streptomyces sp. NPDC020983 TaxID=3365106 RepID=UPI0037A58771
MRATDDDEAARFLTYLAVIQIRAMARRRKPFHAWMGDDYVACIAWLADLVHNLAGAGARPQRWGLRRKRHPSMAYTWAVAGRNGRKWILDSLEQEGLAWDPPPETSFGRERDDRG